MNVLGKVETEQELQGFQINAYAKDDYDYTEGKEKIREMNIDILKPIENGIISGTYNWLNGKAKSALNFLYKKYILYTGYEISSNSSLNYDYDSKQTTGNFGGKIKGIQIGDYNYEVYANFSSEFDSISNGEIGAFISNAYKTTKVGIASKTSFRGAKSERNEKVVTFDHQIDQKSFLHIEGTKNSDGDSLINGYIDKALGSLTVRLFFKMDKDMNFSISV